MEKNSLMQVGSKGDYDVYEMMPSSIVDAMEGVQSEFITRYGKESEAGLNESYEEVTQSITIKERRYEYVEWGIDNLYPYHVKTLIGKNMVTSQCQQFNSLVSYGQGLQFFDRDTGERTTDPDIRRFCLSNALHRQFLAQITDMKYYFFSVLRITLSRDGTKIVQVRRQEACHCRFSPRKNGVSKYVIIADWRDSPVKSAVVLPLLDEIDPYGDLMVRLGKEPDPKTGTKEKPTSDRSFAIKCTIPTVDDRIYPEPYYCSMFHDAWYDIYRLIGVGKRYLIKNTAAPRLQVEIHKNYWNNVCNEEGITDPIKRKERIREEREKITSFCTKPENAGKAWITSFDTVLEGKEIRMVRVYTLGEDKKTGGSWSDDMVEASNSLCFVMGVHPNMVGATPGKSQMNNSGSDKRELFNLKQAIEKPWHDVMSVPYHVIMHFMGWDEKYEIQIPMIEMTTLDKNEEMEVKTE